MALMRENSIKNRLGSCKRAILGLQTGSQSNFSLIFFEPKFNGKSESLPGL